MITQLSARQYIIIINFSISYMKVKPNIIIKSWSLWKQIAIVFLITVVAVIFISGWIIRQFEGNSMLDELFHNSKKIISLLSGASLDAVISEDRPILKTIVIQSIKLDPNIFSIKITNEEGLILVQWQSQGHEPRHTPMLFTEDIVFQGETFGKITVEWDVDSEYHRIKTHIRRIQLLITAIVFLLAAIIISLIHLIVIKPVRIIHQQLIELSNDNETTKLDLWASKELVFLAESVNTLRELMKFKKSREWELETKVRERTAELEREIEERIHAEEDNRKFETQLRKSQKLEAIGTLAGGIAHDFNNILGSMIGFTQLALYDVEKGTILQKNLQEVLIAGKRAKALVDQILAFSSQSDKDLEPVQVKLIVKEALKLIRASLPATIEIQQDFQSDSAILADSGKIHQVIMNLCTNAGHAMQKKGGIITIRLKDVNLDSQFVDLYQNVKPGKFIELSVSDTGHGIPDEIIERIFDPFFTTKPPGEGTGMGLSILHGIVTSLGGLIRPYSEPGKGSTFNIYLPRIDRAIQSEIELHIEIPGGTEKILFVDDEPSLVNMGKQMLQKLGYHVEGRNSSIEALELFKSQPARFDLVITDMAMPNMTGIDLAKEMMNIRPDLPIIICTGFSEVLTEEKAKDMGIKAFVKKPILIEDIALTIRKVIKNNQ